jgi:hypothetical protein
VGESTSSGAAGRIFMSYRRQDTEFPAGWLYDRLSEHFHRGEVFKDVDAIRLGEDYVAQINRAVGSCDVLLALIGPDWLAITDDTGRRRLDDPADFVRLEIQAALVRKVMVIPILVGGATMPRAEDLPNVIRNLSYRTALELSPRRFDYDVGRLLEVLDETLSAAPVEELAHPIAPRPAISAPRPAVTGPPGATARPVGLGRARSAPAVLATLAIAALGVLLVVVLRPGRGDSQARGGAGRSDSTRAAAQHATATALTVTQMVLPARVGGGSKENHLHVLASNGAEVVDLSRSGSLSGSHRDARAPALSPNRQQIAYISQRDPDSSARPIPATVRVVDVQGHNDHPIATPDCPNPSRLDWSPRLGPAELVLACQFTTSESAILTVDRNGQVTHRILRRSAGRFADDPSFSSDGRTVVYWDAADSSARTGALHIVPVDGSGGRDPIDLGDGYADPSFGPDDHIVVTHLVTGGARIEVLDRAGTHLDWLTEPGEFDKPCWSPTGASVVASSAEDGQDVLRRYRVDSTTHGRSKMVAVGVGLGRPAW